MVSLIAAAMDISPDYVLDFELDSDDEELIRELESGCLRFPRILQFLHFDSSGGPNVAGMNFRHAVLDWQHAIHQ